MVVVGATAGRIAMLGVVLSWRFIIDLAYNLLKHVLEVLLIFLFLFLLLLFAAHPEVDNHGFVTTEYFGVVEGLNGLLGLLNVFKEN